MYYGYFKISVCVYVCVVISEKSIILFEAWLTFVKVLIENDEPDRLAAAQIPQRVPEVQEFP